MSPMMRERPPSHEGASPEPTPASRPRVYEPPAVLWEQPFVALAQVSRFDGGYGCEIPGSCEDAP
jgi:hypothetical protein